MTKLPEAKSNILTDRTDAESYSTNSVIQAACDIATEAVNTAEDTPTLPLITFHPDAKSEAEKRNHSTQVIMGAKEGVTEGRWQQLQGCQ